MTARAVADLVHHRNGAVAQPHDTVSLLGEYFPSLSGFTAKHDWEAPVKQLQVVLYESMVHSSWHRPEECLQSVLWTSRRMDLCMCSAQMERHPSVWLCLHVALREGGMPFVASQCLGLSGMLTVVANVLTLPLRAAGTSRVATLTPWITTEYLLST